MDCILFGAVLGVPFALLLIFIEMRYQVDLVNEFSLFIHWIETKVRK